jgi:GT2 family glycosyltransferase
MGDLSRRAAIVIPVFNGAFYTRVCLTSLQAEQGEAEVIVVDNGSTDETPALLEAWAHPGPGRRFLRFDQVLGFARACNAGAGATEREFVVFLNNDTFVLEGWLNNLLRPFDEAADVQVTGSRLLYPSGHLQHAGIAFNRLGPHHVFVGLPRNTPFVLHRRDFQTVTGAALAIRRAEFERQGGFDTSYQNSFEDVDLCLKVKRDGGRIVYVPDSVAYHFESMTEGRLGPTDMRNYELFMERWGNVFEQDIDALHEEAVAAGLDLSERIPSRREVVDREERLAGTEAELKELRRMRDLRSVRAALWARNTFRRVFPAS